MRPPNSRRSSASRCCRGSASIARHSAARSALPDRLGERIVRRGDRLELLHRQRLAHARADPRPAFVARDRGEPRCRLARLGAVQKRAVRGEERLLRRVLGLGAIAQQRRQRPLTVRPYSRVEQLGPRSGRPVAGAAARHAAIRAGALVVATSATAVRGRCRRRGRRHRDRHPGRRSSRATESWIVTVWPTSDAGSVRPAGSGTVSVWPWTVERDRCRQRPP